MKKFSENGVYIIAEVSQTHDGSLGQAHAFIDAVSKTGANAVKFQTHFADEESTPQEPFRIKFSYEDNSRFEYWKRMEFSEKEWKGLYDHANEVGLDFLSSPFSIKAMNLLEKIGIKYWKIGSGEAFNNILLSEISKTKKPVLLSTGMSTYSDIKKQLEILKDSEEVVLLQCTTEYPVKPKNILLNEIKKLGKKFNVKTGFSDHSGSIVPSLSAATLGASVIEVHVTFSKHMFGPDVSSSITIEELSTLVKGIRMIEEMKKGENSKDNLDINREKLKKIFTKSFYAKRLIKKGEIIKIEDLFIKKPLDGISVHNSHEVIGKRAKKNIEFDKPIRYGDVE